MLKSVFNWIDQRTGIVSAIDFFLEEEIPASAGWHQVFGSVCLFAFLLQVVTGLLMSVNYAPTPGEAWESLRYVVTQVTAGSIIRGLHHWGASAMIVVVGLHMAQVFLWGAYKKPREATWMIGVVLLVLTLAFGLSGYLLAWDNRAYWGTMVTTRITAMAPGGSILLRLLGTDGSSIGRVTFARFYAAHVTLLPIVTLLLIVFHVILVRRHGVAPAPGDESRPKKRFFPEQVFKDTVAITIWCVAVACMVAFVKVPLGHVADPTDTSYVPRPEWYFLFLFQMLKLFEGPLEFFGAVVLPGLAMAVLLLMPFIDRGRMLRITQRTGAIAVVALAALGWTALTARAVATTPKQIEDENLEDPQPWQLVPASQLLGTAALRTTAPPNMVQGAIVYQANQCSMCHTLNGEGAKVGPVLNGLRTRHDRAWVLGHFVDPDKYTPGSEMPPFDNLGTQELENLTDYVLSIPK